MTPGFHDTVTTIGRVCYLGSTRPVGVAFLVGTHYLLTCTHVVADARGTSRDVTPATGTPINVQFLPDGPLLVAEVVICRPMREPETGDIAVLELTDDPPQGVRSAVFVEAQDLWRHGCAIYGFPRDAEEGRPASGTLQVIDGTGWLQIDDAAAGVVAGYSGSPVWDEEYRGVVGLLVAARRGQAWAIPVSLLIEAWNPLRQIARPQSPFRGLQPFGPDDREVFFGREREIDQLCDLVSESRIITVVGPSGVGKSSLAAAGLLGEVVHESGTVGVVLKVGGAASLSEAIDHGFWRGEFKGEPERARELLCSWLKAMANADSMSASEHITADQSRRAFGDDSIFVRRAVVVVDQLDEVLAADPSFARSIDLAINRMICNVDSGGPQLAVVVLLRDDFLSMARMHTPAVWRSWDRLRFTVAPMGLAALRRAISEPLRSVPPVRAAGGLVERILRDTPKGPSALPLVEHTLSLLWDKQDHAELTNAAYEELGGVGGALSQHAEQLYGRLTELEHTAARGLFVQLVRPDELQAPDPGHVPRDTRRIARRDELTEGHWGLARQLAHTRLIATTSGDDVHGTVELAHEALIQHWPRLQRWVDETRRFRLWQERLRADLYRWRAELGPNRRSLLLRGRELQEALHQLRINRDQVMGAEREFIVLSQQRRFVRRLVSTAIAAVVLLAFGVIWGQQYARTTTAQQQQQASETRRVVQHLLTQSKDAAGNDPPLALRLALAAHVLLPSPVTETNVYATLASTGYAGDLPRSQPGEVIALAPNAGVLATSSSAGHNALWDITDPRQVRPLASDFTSGNGFVNDVAFSRTGRLLATAGNRHTVDLWDVATPAKPRHVSSFTSGGPSLPPGNTEFLSTVAFSPGNDVLAAGGDGGTVRFWDIADPSSPYPVGVPFGSQTSIVRSVAFSPSGEKLAIGSDDGTATVWDVSQLTRPHKVATFAGHELPVMAVEFAKNNNLLATGSEDGTAILWNLDAGGDVSSQVSAELRGHYREGGNVEHGVLSLTFSPDGRTLATGSADKTVILWDVTVPTSPRQIGQPLQGAGWMSSVAFTLDGAYLAAADGRTVRLWDVASPFRSRRTSTAIRLPSNSTVLISKHRNLMAIAQNSSVAIWDIANPDVPRHLYVFPDTLNEATNGLAFSIDGTRLATTTANFIDFWNIDNPARPARLARWTAGQDDRISVGEFLDGGSMFAAGVNHPAEDSKVALISLGRDTKIELQDVLAVPQKGASQRAVTSMAYMPTVDRLLVGTSTGELITWDVTHRQPISVGGPVSAHTGPVFSLRTALNNDIVVSSGPGRVGVWRMTPSGQLQLSGSPPVGTHSWVVTALSPDGRSLVVSSGTTAILWDISVPEVPAQIGSPLVGQDNTIEWIEFSPDGQYVAATGDTLIMWDLTRLATVRSKAVQQACLVTDGGFTPEQWKAHVAGIGYRPSCL